MQMLRCNMTRTPTSAPKLTRKPVCEFGKAARTEAHSLVRGADLRRRTRPCLRIYRSFPARLQIVAQQGLVCAPELSYPGMHADACGLACSVLAWRLGFLVDLGGEVDGIARLCTGCCAERPLVSTAGWGVDRPSVLGITTVAATLSGATLRREGNALLMTVPGGALYAATPGLGEYVGCIRR